MRFVSEIGRTAERWYAGFRIPERTRHAFALLALPYNATARLLHRLMPRGLFSRALLIIVTPMVLLQSVLTWVFLDRHYDLVTRRLSEAVVGEIAAIVDILERYPQDENYRTLIEIAEDKLELSISVLPPEPLPPPRPKPFFDLVDRYLSEQLRVRIGRPFWIDTIGRSRFVEMRIQLKDHVLRVIARRSQAYASNSHIFIVWMVSTSALLIAIALVFLRNQIRPIEQLADAAEGFGKGRPIERFRPRGAREVRRAAQAFIEMRRRIERQIEQRTAMLAGISHDLRTVLTRFRLQLALLPKGHEVNALQADVDEMNGMLEDYLAFVRGDGNEQAKPTDVALLFEDLEAQAEVAGAEVSSQFTGKPEVVLKGIAVRRCLTNLVANATRHGSKVRIEGRNADGWLTITIDDDGPGIPMEERENVFRPFYRLDTARNLDAHGSGLGLAIARDIVRGHGGSIMLEDGPLGGLRVRIRIPA